jgi:hypothetical protein
MDDSRQWLRTQEVELDVRSRRARFAIMWPWPPTRQPHGAS